jgi:NTE family protein
MNKILLFLFGIAFLHPLFAQDTITSKKPKIGLVLSGGGAKGFAHIGVLKILEKAGVKIDFIGGTSMGAVVGGLYASGYNATQIDSIFSNTDFDQLIQDYIPRSSKSFFEKRNDEMYALTLPFNKFKVGVPLAFSRGMYNYCLLSRLTHKVRFVRDFDKLPIPFFCIATDIEKGEQVLLKNGYLAQAIFASSAFPSLYSPVEIDGKLMIDGGVINNYPVEEIRKMGADIVIGVDVQDDLKDRSSLNDASKILVQISNIDMIKVMDKKIKLTDIYIKPKVSEFGVISFVDGKEIQMKGELAATEVFEQLKKLADSSYTFKLNNIKTKKEYLQFKSISINKLESYTRSYVLGKLRIKNDQKISYQDIEDGINNLNATHNFNSISYSIEGSDNAEELKLNLSENTIKTFLKFGLHYDGLYKSAALANFTNKKILFKNDVASLDVGLGDNIRYNFDYYIDNGFYWSFGIKSRFNSFARGIKTDFSNGNLLSQLSLKTININFSDLTNQAYLQTVFIQKFLIGAGLEHKYLNIISENLQPTNSIIERSSYASVFGYMKYDSFDNKLFPKKGWLLATDIQSYLYSTDYTKRFNKYSVAKAELGIVKTINNNISFKLQTDVGFAFGDSSIEFFDFILGGYGFNPINNFKHFYGYDFLSISGDSFIKSCFTIDYEIYKKNHINLAANYANIGDNLFANKDWLSKPQHTGYAIGYGLESVIGPIEIKYSWSPELRNGFTYVSVGFWF